MIHTEGKKRSGFAFRISLPDLNAEMPIQTSGKREITVTRSATAVKTHSTLFRFLLTDIAFPPHSSCAFSEPISMNTTLLSSPMMIISSSDAATV